MLMSREEPKDAFTNKNEQAKNHNIHMKHLQCGFLEVFHGIHSKGDHLSLQHL